MPNISEMSGAPRRELHVFYVLDTSGSMEGLRIATLNRAMTETVTVLQEQALRNADAQLKIAVLEFNTIPRWLNPAGPERMEDFIFENLTAGGLTEVGAALEELGSKLSREKFLKSMTGAYLPIIIFMTDGYATDDYTAELSKIQKNRWFASSVKIGFAIGDEPDANMIAQIVGNSEAVIQTDDLALFARLLKWASVTASMMCSKSHTSYDIITGGDIIAQVTRNNSISASSVIPQSAVSVSPDVDPNDVWDDGDLWDDDSFN